MVQSMLKIKKEQTSQSGLYLGTRSQTVGLTFFERDLINYMTAAWPSTIIMAVSHLCPVHVLLQHFILCFLTFVHPRNVAAKGGFPTLNGVTTLYDLFEQSVSKYPDNKCLGWRPIKDGKAQDYVYITYKQVQGDLQTQPWLVAITAPAGEDCCGESCLMGSVNCSGRLSTFSRHLEVMVFPCAQA